MIDSDNKLDIDVSMISRMVYEESRLNSFIQKEQWPFLKDCNCTPEKMAEAGFYWCGNESQPDLVRCFVCLKEFEDWEPDDNPKEEHKRLCPTCPFIKLGKTQDNCTVKEVIELCQKSLKALVEKAATLKVEQYVAQAKEVRAGLELIGAQNNFDMCD